MHFALIWTVVLTLGFCGVIPNQQRPDLSESDRLELEKLQQLTRERDQREQLDLQARREFEEVEKRRDAVRKQQQNRLGDGVQQSPTIQQTKLAVKGANSGGQQSGQSRSEGQPISSVPRLNQPGSSGGSNQQSQGFPSFSVGHSQPNSQGNFAAIDGHSSLSHQESNPKETPTSTRLNIGSNLPPKQPSVETTQTENSNGHQQPHFPSIDSTRDQHSQTGLQTPSRHQGSNENWQSRGDGHPNTDSGRVPTVILPGTNQDANSPQEFNSGPSSHKQNSGRQQ